MDEFIHCPKPYLLLSATCDEILSWVFDIWMKNHLASDSICNAVKPFPPPKKKVGLIFGVGDTTPRFTISIEQDN